MITNKLSKFFAVEIKNLDVKGRYQTKKLLIKYQYLIRIFCSCDRNQNITDDDHIILVKILAPLN